MAIAQGDGSIVLTTKVDESGMKKGFSSMTNMAKKTASTVGKAFTAISVAAGAAIVAITKQAVEAYADYEQLVGGVETLFKDSAKKVQKYAQEAYKTAGLSVNEYMKQVTSFSASLIRSTANDTEKAADIANMALIDISDNVNKMGSSMESVTLAYQGFAKQQYQLLDNLKLGYGGTKTEMERLLRDAEALTGVKYDINNLADVYSAIHAIQEQLGITGTTAKEAEKTISGSATTTKAAWQNVLTAISGGGDLDRAIENLVDSISNLFNNIVPVVERSLKGIGRLIERVAPQLVQTVAKALIEAIPSLLNAVYEMIIGLAKGIYQGITDLFRGKATEIIESQAEKVEETTKNQNSLTEAVKETNKELKGSLAGFDELNTITKDSGELDMSGVLPSSSSATTLNIQTQFEDQKIETPKPILAFLEKIKKILQPTSKLLKDCVKATKDWVKNVDFSAAENSFEGLFENFGQFNEELHEVFGFLYEDILLPIAQWAAESVIPAAVDAISEAFNSLTVTLDAVKNGWSAFTEKIKPFTDFIGDVVVGIIEFFGDVFRKVADVIQSKGDTIQGIFEGIGDIVLALQPIFEALWFVIEKVFTFIAEIIGGVVGLIIDVLGGLIDFIVGVFSGDWERAWGGIKGIFVGIWDFICNILSGFWQFLKDVFSPIIDWIDENIIQPIGNFFSDLWEGIKKGMKAFANFFIGIINGLIGGLESFINFFVDAINKVVDAMNSLSFDVPDWVPGIGGETFGFNLSRISKVSMSRIPELAQGAVIPGGKEFLAVLGDQPQGQTNIEAPLATIKQALIEAMSEFGGGSNNQPIIIEIDGREVFRAVRNAESRYGSQTMIGGVVNAY